MPAQWVRGVLICQLLAACAIAQPPPPRVNPAGNANRPAGAEEQNPQQPPQQQAPPRTGPPTIYGGLTLNNASLSEVIDMLARQLHINYILDKNVQGGVILNTYG